MLRRKIRICFEESGDMSPFLREENWMSEELRNTTDVDTIFADISTMIYDAKTEVMLRVNTSVITLYWNIGKKLPEETIANEIAELRDERKMSLDMFYRDPYMLDFLGLKDTYSEKDLENAILAELE